MMKLPYDHSCDGAGCDPEDQDHRNLRLKKSKRAQIRAESTADQAWKRASEWLPKFLEVKNKLGSKEDEAFVQITFDKDDVAAINVALSLIIGEIFLRESQTRGH